MKTIFLISAIILSVSVSGQCYREPGSLSVGIGFGYSTVKSANMDLRIKATADNYYLQFGFSSNMSSKVTTGVAFYAGGGYDIKMSESVSLSPLIGYQYTHRSNDRKELNGMGYIAGLTVYKYMWDGGSLYLSGLNTKSGTAITIGILATF